MSNTYFKFKQFTVYQDMSAMKVGTDGVLLGAWSDISSSSRILDIGTGTGLIALICAQRSEDVIIDAIDIDKGAYDQASLNFSNSKFNNRINVFHLGLQDFYENRVGDYSHIICNPPFFNSSLKPFDKQRSLARHDDSLPLESLFELSYYLSNDTGSLSLIIPFDRFAEISNMLQFKMWNISRKTIVYPTLNSKPKRLLLELSKDKSVKSIENTLIIEEQRHIYTKSFTELVKPFYLNL